MGLHRPEPRAALRLDIKTAAVYRRARLGLTGRAAGGLGLAVLLVAACSTAAPTPSAATGAPIDVVTTTTVFADMVQQVGGAHVKRTSVVPKGGDVHTFEPKPSDVQRIAAAKLLVMNGLGPRRLAREDDHDRQRQRHSAPQARRRA